MSMKKKMIEDLGKLTGITMTIYASDEHKKFWHRGWIGTIIQDSSLEGKKEYKCKLKSRYTKGNNMSLKFNIE